VEFGDEVLDHGEIKGIVFVTTTEGQFFLGVLTVLHLGRNYPCAPIPAITAPFARLEEVSVHITDNQSELAVQCSSITRNTGLIDGICLLACMSSVVGFHEC
jgi:hypothetical protein